MTEGDIRVRARIRLLPTAESGRTVPIQGSYRPNHNFLDRDNREMAMGFINFTEGELLLPGESAEVEVTFWSWPRLAGEVYPGREWLIQEGPTVVGVGTVLEVIA